MNAQIWLSHSGAETTIPAMRAIFRRMSAPPKTSVTSSLQSPVFAPVPSARLSAGIAQYGARMNAPSPWSYHQKQTAVAIRMNRSARATRLRSSRRCAMRLIVAAASRGGRRRRRGRRTSLTVVPFPRERSDAAGLIGPSAQLGGACLRGAGLGLGGLGVHLCGQGTVARGEGAAGRHGRRSVLATHVVVLHALHLALEDPQRATERA